MASAAFRQASIRVMVAGGSEPITRLMSAVETVTRCSHLTAEVCSNPERWPSGELGRLRRRSVRRLGDDRDNCSIQASVVVIRLDDQSRAQLTTASGCECDR